MDQEDEAKKIFISTVCLMGLGAIPIHTEWPQISDAPQ